MNPNTLTQAKRVLTDVEVFVQEERPKLLRYLDGKAPQALDDLGPLEYIERVLDEWSQRFIGRDLAEPCLRERAFWFALYQLEELVEHPVQGQLDPYEAVLLGVLAEVTEILRNWQELPEQYFASRPGEI